MPRITRGLAGGMFYHVLNRGNGRQAIFRKDYDYRAFRILLDESLEKYSVKLYAWCLMPNHFHMLTSPDKAEDLSNWMQWLMTSHVRRYHKHYGTCGHVWQGRFKSFVVQEDEYLLTVVRYIEGNPVRAGKVASAAEWKWSSHVDRVKGKTSILSRLPIEVPAHWSQYVDTPMTDTEKATLRKSVNRQAPYGDEKWQQRISSVFGLGSTLRPKGRPPKII